MRRGLFLESVLLPVILTIGVTAFSASTATALPLSPGETTAAKPAKKAAKSSAKKTTTTKATYLPQKAFQGKVTALDATAKTLTVDGKSGDKVTFSWTDETTTTKPGGKTAETVKVGDSVKILYTNLDDTKTATKVFINFTEPEDSGGGHPRGTCLCSDGTYLKKCCTGSSGS